MNWKFIFPKANSSWYTTYKLSNELAKTDEEYFSNINQDELSSSANMILKMVESEVDALGDPTKVFIGGFGEGAVTALAAFLKYKGDKPLGGIIVMSGLQQLDYTKRVNFDNKT